jgi:hypothetical protein
VRQFASGPYGPPSPVGRGCFQMGLPHGLLESEFSKKKAESAQNGFRGGAYYPGECGKYYLARCALKRPLPVSDRPSDVESCDRDFQCQALQSLTRTLEELASGTIKVSSVRLLFRGQQRPSSHCHCLEGPFF